MKTSTEENSKVLFLSSVMLLLIAVRSDLMFEGHDLYYGKWMHFIYLKSASSFLGINPIAPYCWRILVPFLVRTLPLRIEIGFFVITYLSFVVSALLIFKIIKHLFSDIVYPWIGVLTYFSLINVVRLSCIEFIAVDPPAFMFMLMAIYSIYYKNDALFIISTTLGVLTKETTFLILPLYLSINYVPRQDKQHFYKLLYKTFKLCTPAIVIYMLLRIIIVPQENYNYYDLFINTTVHRINSFFGIYSTLNKDVFTHQNAFENSLINIYRLTFGALGPMLFFIIIKAGRIKNIFFRFSPLIGLSLLQLFIAGDNERIVAVGFPAYILLYLTTLQSFVKDNRIGINHFLIYSLVIFISQLFLTNNYYYQIYYSVLLQLILGLGMLALIYFTDLMLPHQQFKAIKKE